MRLEDNHEQRHVRPKELHELELVVALFQVHHKENESWMGGSGGGEVVAVALALAVSKQKKGIGVKTTKPQFESILTKDVKDEANEAMVRGER